MDGKIFLVMMSTSDLVWLTAPGYIGISKMKLSNTIPFIFWTLWSHTRKKKQFMKLFLARVQFKIDLIQHEARITNISNTIWWLMLVGGWQKKIAQFWPSFHFIIILFCQEMKMEFVFQLWKKVQYRRCGFFKDCITRGRFSENWFLASPGQNRC